MAYTPKQLGHLVIKVRDIDRSVEFYTEVLGLTVMTARPGGMTFLSADTTMSHELALVPLGMDAPGPEERRVGLAHMAWQMNSFRDLKELYQRCQERGVRIKRLGDHGISMGVYIYDPDDNEMRFTTSRRSRSGGTRTGSCLRGTSRGSWRSRLRRRRRIRRRRWRARAPARGAAAPAGNENPSPPAGASSQFNLVF